MRIREILILSIGLIATVGCRSTTVRGPDGQSLTATTPRSMTIHRGESSPLSVDLDQENSTEPVTVTISRLSDGIEAIPASQVVQTTTATFMLRASSTADLVTDQAVMVTVEGLNGRKASHHINLTVRE